MNEREWIRRLRTRAAGADHLVRGIGDDCAVLRPPAGTELLVTTDLFIEGTHFRRRSAPPRALGWRALARALSDVAAMGGTPLAYFVSIAVPEWAWGPWLKDFYKGMSESGSRTGAVLAGGDTTRARTLTADLIVLGHAPAGRALRRDGAKTGDAIYVSGELGVEAPGKRIRFEPRLALGRYLLENRLASACMDVSDGLAMDLSRLCEESGVAAALASPLPLAQGVAVERALTHGEDYELLFTVPSRQRVPATFNGVPLTRVGTIVAGKAGRVTLDAKPLAARGWDPFKL